MLSCSTNSVGGAVVEDVATALEEMNAMLEVSCTLQLDGRAHVCPTP